MTYFKYKRFVTALNIVRNMGKDIFILHKLSLSLNLLLQYLYTTFLSIHFKC